MPDAAAQARRPVPVLPVLIRVTCRVPLEDAVPGSAVECRVMRAVRDTAINLLRVEAMAKPGMDWVARSQWIPRGRCAPDVSSSRDFESAHYIVAARIRLSIEVPPGENMPWPNAEIYIDQDISDQYAAIRDGEKAAA